MSAVLKPDHCPVCGTRCEYSPSCQGCMDINCGWPGAFPELEIKPITFRSACAFVAEYHRHNKPPRGHKFSVGLYARGVLVGVGMAGRPVARAFDDGVTLEVNRTCTDGTDNANSMIYGALWRAGKAMGYRRIITYTQADESGASLRAAGFVRVKGLEARKSWAESSVKQKAMRDPVGNGGVARVLWEIRATGRTSDAEVRIGSTAFDLRT